MEIPTNLAIISNLLIPLLSVSGLLAGVFLSYLAQEEVVAGKKYFVTLYRVLFVALSVLISLFIYATSSILTATYLFFSIVLLVVDLTKPSPYLFYLHYFFFLVGYFLAYQQLLVAAVLFLYGLPIGTLLRVKEK